MILRKKSLVVRSIWIDPAISKIEDESHHTKEFKFSLPTKDSELGLTLASAY